MTRSPFIPIAGRVRSLEWLRQRVRDSLPGPLRRAVVTALAPMRARRRARAEDVAVKRALTRDEDRQRYRRLVEEAERRWWTGEYDATGEPQVFPLRGTETVWLRPGTSDLLVYRDVVVRDNYGDVRLPRNAVVLDCGANIGLVTATLLSRHPDARALAIEPDPENFALCCRNLAMFGDRVTTLRAAIWNESGWMRLAGGGAGTWASRVEPGSGDVEALTIQSAVARLGVETIDLLKLDIEGAEANILASDTSWLTAVNCLMVELESDQARLAYNDVMRRHPEFRLAQRGDVTIAVRAR
jgi:FkbM family methyltransferase